MKNQMKIMKRCRIIILILGLFGGVKVQASPADYIVLVSRAVSQDTSWEKVVHRLAEVHQAVVVKYDRVASEALPRLRELFPRYVAVVEKPENITRNFVVDINRMSRQVDEDIFSDFLWGIITGIDAQCALELVERAQTSKVVKSAWCLGVSDFKDGKNFEQMGLGFGASDWREKNGWGDTVRTMNFSNQPSVFKERVIGWAEKYNPDLILCQVEEPGNQIRLFQDYEYTEGYLKPNQGKLWTGTHEFRLSDNSRVCIMPFRGVTFWGTKENVPFAWLKAGQAAALIGLTDYSFHGRGEWGTLKYWMTDAGRYTLAEAHFLNQQEMLYKLYQWSPDWLEQKYAYVESIPQRVMIDLYHSYENYQEIIKQLTGDLNEALDKFCYMFERDIMVYFGDPCWNVRMGDFSKDHPYQVSCKKKGKKCVVTFKTSKDFTWERLCGEMRSRHQLGDPYCAVGDLPVCYFFPERLKNPHLLTKQNMMGEIVVNKDFLFIYNAYWEPNKTYKVVFEVEK